MPREGFLNQRLDFLTDLNGQKSGEPLKKPLGTALITIDCEGSEV